jgi:hypothetical protein
MALRSPYTSPSVRSPDFPFVRRLSNTSPTAGANNWFVRSLAVGTGDGRTWLNAFTTLAAALTAGAAGDKFWVSEDHAETLPLRQLSCGLTVLAQTTAPRNINIWGRKRRDHHRPHWRRIGWHNTVKLEDRHHREQQMGLAVRGIADCDLERHHGLSCHCDRRRHLGQHQSAADR